MKKIILSFGNHNIDITKDLQKTKSVLSAEAKDGDIINAMMSLSIGQGNVKNKKLTIGDILQSMNVKIIDKENESESSSSIFIEHGTTDGNEYFILNNKLE